MFKCNKCGACCQSIGGVEEYVDLDDGSGVCKYFNRKTKLCAIYEKRPLKCRIDDAYEAYFSSILSKIEYYKINYSSCKKLRKMER